MNYDNFVCISTKQRDKFLKDRTTTPSSFSNCISSLAKIELLDIQDRNQYFINPDFFTKRDWTGTKALRASWTFGSDGVESNRDIIDENGDVIIEGE